MSSSEQVASGKARTGCVWSFCSACPENKNWWLWQGKWSVPDKGLMERTSQRNFVLTFQRFCGGTTYTPCLSWKACLKTWIPDTMSLVNDIAVNAEEKALYFHYVLYMVRWAHTEEWKAHIAEYKMSLAAHKLYFKCSVKLAYFYESRIHWQTIYRQNVIAAVLKIVLMI